MYSAESIENLLASQFNIRHVRSFITHYNAMLNEFQKSEWELAISKSGKFVEALMKSMLLHVGGTLPPARKFKVGNVINTLNQLPQGSYDDTIRITIPRACEFIYDIGSNRGSRHDPDEINPNEMDANVVVSTCSWLLGEVLRYSQKGVSDLGMVREQINSIVQRKYPQIENVDGRIYFHFKGLSARDVGLLYLWYKYPSRVNNEELYDVIVRHGNKRSNARLGITRLRNYVDIDIDGKMRLLQPGIKLADKIIEEKCKSGN